MHDRVLTVLASKFTAKSHKPSFISHERSAHTNHLWNPDWGFGRVDESTWPGICHTSMRYCVKFTEAVILPQLNGNLRGSSDDQQKRKWRKPKQVGTCISYGNHLWYWCHFEEQSSMDDRIPLGNENVLHQETMVAFREDPREKKNEYFRALFSSLVTAYIIL